MKHVFLFEIDISPGSVISKGIVESDNEEEAYHIVNEWALRNKKTNGTIKIYPCLYIP